MLGNTLYGLSVLLKNPEVGQSEGSYLLHHLPWLVGSLGVLLLDTIVSFRVCDVGKVVWARQPQLECADPSRSTPLSTHPSSCPFVHSPLIHTSIHLSIHPPSCCHLLIYLSTHLLTCSSSIYNATFYQASIYPSDLIHVPVCLSIHLPTHSLTIQLPIYPSICSPICI